MSVTLAQYAQVLQRSATGAQDTAAAAIRQTSQHVEAQVRASGPLPSGLTVTFPDQASSVIGTPKPLGVWQDPLAGVWSAPPPTYPVIVPGAAAITTQLVGDLGYVKQMSRYRWYGYASRAGARAARRVVRQPDPDKDQKRLAARAGFELAETLARMIAHGLQGH